MLGLRKIAGLGAAAVCCGLFLASSLPAQAADPNKVLHVGFEIEETGFDPAKVTDNYSSQILLEVMESLLTYDYLARPAKLVPLTAESLPEISDEGKTYLVHIRHGIYFHPDPAFKGHKRELTAMDYAYSIKRFVDPRNRSPWRFLVAGKIIGLDELAKKAEHDGAFDYDAPVRGLEIVDRYTLRIRLNATDFNFSYILAMPALSAVAREVIEAYPEDTNAHPIGTGPYILTSWLRKSKMVLEANPDYREVIWNFKGSDDPRDKAAVAAMTGKRIPQIGRVEINVIAEEQSRWLAFEHGEIDYIDRFGTFAPIAIPDGHLAPSFVARGISLDRSVEAEITYYGLDMQDPVVGGSSLEKIALRRAILLAYDIDQEIRVIRKGQAMALQGPVPPGVVGHDPQYRSIIRYDPTLANALLDYFGYKKGARRLPQQPRRQLAHHRPDLGTAGDQPRIRRAVEEEPGCDRLALRGAEERVFRQHQGGAGLPPHDVGFRLGCRLPRRRRFHAAALRAEHPRKQQRLLPVGRLRQDVRCHPAPD